MSAISEIDIRDWDKIDLKKARESTDKILDNLPGIYLAEPVHQIYQFINAIEKLRNKQIEIATRHIPRVLLKERDD
jgi:hypothetical protein